ncbi:hypothetical protein JM83_0354 [Gillisia sp. Hel_I_86]|uniref:hypothetical protein n=1 Tax=Gillisia sp. Hel_I_86 TaxID=1249981 RepID=UPI00119C3E98|nr:hypothetical protein [Gillisia sp. Hel_I_86]TVZ25442.1 hypothetical protein JM83_0354 [Gillisia sp. Hel_I_86]
MRIFEEKQRFRQWWVILILTATAVGVLVNLYYETEGFTIIESNFSLIFAAIIIAIVIVGFFMLELRTKIDPIGITATFHPISFFSKHYNWSQIDKVYVRKYAPLTEYGGWGIRGLGEAKAYNVAGNYGIQIVTKKKKRFLIGTQRPQDAEQVLKRYTEKISL